MILNWHFNNNSNNNNNKKNNNKKCSERILRFDVGLECFLLFVSPIILVSIMLRKAEMCKAKCVIIFPECNAPFFGMKEGNVHSFIVYLMYLPKEKQFFIPY